MVAETDSHGSPRALDPGTGRTPNGPAQRALLRAFSDALELVVGLDDDLIALAGDGQRAAIVFAEVSRHVSLGRAASVLADARTVRALAALLEHECDWDAALALQDYEHRPAMFVVHDGAGSLAYANRLHGPLGVDQLFYGVAAQATEGGTLEASSIEEVAAGHVERIRSLYPNGPYLFYGASAGGVIAMEIARLLVIAGEEVPLVVLGDSVAPSAHGAPPIAPPEPAVPAPADGGAPVSLRRRARARLGPLVRAGWRLRVGATAAAREQRRADRARRKHERVFTQALSLGERVPPPARGYYILHQYGRLLIRHRPRGPFPDHIVLLRAGADWMAADRGWRAFVGDQLEIVDIEGTHSALGLETSGGYVGAAIAAILERLWP